MRSVGQRKRARVVLEVLLILAALLLVAYILRRHTPRLLELLKSGNVTDIEAYVKSEGGKGRLILILLQIIETVAIVLPAMPVYICAGAVYGKIQGFLMCYLTNVAMNVLIFLAAGKMKTTMAEFAKFQKNPRLEEWVRKTKHPERVVLLMCMLPIIPNGMIPYVSAQTGVTLPAFARALAAGCLPGILIFVCCGDLLLSEHFQITLPIVLLLVLCFCAVMLFRKKITAWMEPRVNRFLA